MKTTVPTCPECGGILQTTQPERLTSAEVAAADPAPGTAPACQCLLCGYEDRPAPEPVAEAR